MTIKDDFLREAKVGSKVEVVVGPKEIKGIIVSLNASIVKIKADDGKIRTVAPDNIACYEIVSAKRKNSGSVPVKTETKQVKANERTMSTFQRAKYLNENSKNKKDYEEAAKVYLQAIRENDRPGSATADLVRLFMQQLHDLDKAAEYLGRYGSKYMRKGAYENVCERLIARKPKLKDAILRYEEKERLAQKAGKENSQEAIKDFPLKDKLREEEKKYIVEDKFIGEADIAQKIIDRFQNQIEWHMSEKYVVDETQKDNYLVIATLIRQMIDRDGETEDFNEKNYKEKDAFASFFDGSYRLYTKKTMHNNLDTARYCFFKSILIFQESETLHQYWAAATILYLEACFSEKEINRDVKKKRYYDLEGTEKNFKDIVKEVMQRKISSTDEEFVIAILEMLEYNFEARDVVLKNIYENSQGEKILDVLESLEKNLEKSAGEDMSGEDEGEEEMTFPQFESSWKTATENYRKDRDKYIHIIKKTIKNAFDSLQLREYKSDFETSKFSTYLTKTDKKHIEKLTEIFNALYHYNVRSEFESKENKLKEADGKRKELEKEIADNPTYFGYEKLMPMLNATPLGNKEATPVLKRLIDKEAENFYEVTKPNITVDQIGEASIDKRSIVCATIAFMYHNDDKLQRAENVRAKISGEGVKVANEKQLEKEVLSIGENEQERLVYFEVTPEIIKRGVFEVNVVITYQYRKGMSETGDGRFERILPIKLYSDVTFEEIENKYEPYCGKEMDDPDMFYGRDKEIESIIETISDESRNKGRCIALYGQARAGKSSILLHLKEKLRECDKEHNVIVDIEDISISILQNMRGLLYALFNELEYEIQKRPYHPALKKILSKAGISIDAKKLKEAEDFQSYFHDVFKEINRCLELEEGGHKYNIIVMMDEFTGIYDRIQKEEMDKHIMKFWKAFVQNNGIFAIVAGHEHMRQFYEDARFSNDCAIMEFHPVTYLSKEAAYQLMYEPIMLETKDGKASRYKDEKVLERFYKLTGGSAYLIINLCKGLVDYLNKTQTVYITQAHINEYLKELKLETIWFDPLYNERGNSDMAKHENNKRILRNIARLSNGREWALLKEVKEKEGDNDIIHRLKQRDVVEVKGDSCRIIVALFKEWILKCPDAFEQVLR